VDESAKLASEYCAVVSGVVAVYGVLWLERD
jgi:hypothetical protein